MKRLIYLFTVSITWFNSYAQPYGVPAQDNPRITYVSPDWNYINQAAATIEARYNQNKDYTDKLIDWIYSLKSQTQDKQFIDALNNYYSKLRSFDGQNFAELGEQIRQVELGIKEEIGKYNDRMKELNDPKKYWDQGNEDVKNKNTDGAIENYSKVIQLNPTFAYSYLRRGHVYYSIQNYKDALVDFNKYLEINPNDTIAILYRGLTKDHLGDYSGAIQDYNKQIDLSPNSNAYYNRGCAKSHLGDEYGAISDFSEAIKLNPNFSMAYNNRAWSKFKLKNFSEALIDVNKSIELDNTNWVAFDSRQEIKFNMGDLKGCIEDCNKALSINPNIANSFYLRGRANFRLGNKIPACQDWSKAGELGKSEAYDLIKKYCNK